jgi:hypothetical protein
MDRDVEVLSSLSSLVDLSSKTGGGLYVARTLRHKRLLAIMRHFCGRVSLCENLDAEDLWPKLSEWIITNPDKASKCATIWLSEWIITNHSTRLMKDPIGDRLFVLKKWGVEISSDLKAKIDAFKTEWNERYRSRQNENLEEKNHQTKQLLKHWKPMLKLLNLTTNDFILTVDGCTDVSLFLKNVRRWSTLKKLGATTFKAHMLLVQSVLSFGRATACRGKHIINAKLFDDFQVLPDNRLLYRYLCEKNGTKSNVQRPIHVCLQLHSDPTLCSVLHMAQFVVYLAYILKKPVALPFYFSVKFDQCKTDVTRYQNAYYKASTLLQCVSITAGVKDQNGRPQMGRSKLHCMRAVANDLMIQGSIDKNARRDHAGWLGGTDDRHYSNSEHIALQSPVPKILSDGAPHVAWNNLNAVPEQILSMLLPDHTTPIMVYFRKVILVALAAGICAPSYAVYFSDITKMSQFKIYKSTVTPTLKVKSSTSSSQQDSLLKKRVIELSTALAMEKQENKRLKLVYGKETQPDEEPALTKSEVIDKLNEITTETTKGTFLDKRSMDWLRACHDRVTNEVVPLISRYTTNDKFIIQLNSAGGKRLIAVLMLAGAYHNFKFNMEATCSAFTSRMSWLGYVAKHRQTSQLFESFKTDSWSSFLMTTQLDKPMKVHEYKAIAL